MIEFIKIPTDEEVKQIEREFMQNPVIGDVSYDRISNCILINTGLNYDYDVAIERLDNRKEILNWIFHLNRKAWMTSEKMGDFIKMISTIIDIWEIIHWEAK